MVFSPSTARRFPKGNEGKTQGGLPLGNPVCLWQTELFKLNLKSSPSSSGYNRRRRLATRSSGKQQAERTAVRAAPIVCPEESPLVRPQAHTPTPLARRLPEGVQGASGKPPASMTRDNFAVSKFPWLGLTRRLRRGKRACSPMGRSLAFGDDPKGVQGASGKPPCLHHGQQLCRRKFPLGGD